MFGLCALLSLLMLSQEEGFSSGNTSREFDGSIYVTVKDVARLFSVSERFVAELTKTKKIRFFKVGRSLRFRVSELLEDWEQFREN